MHSLKSAAGSIGAMGVAEEAAKLEAAGKTADFETIRGSLDIFLQHLAKLINTVDKALSSAIDGKKY
jgi:HPt (histidine-containing phosphotransfer) domain-containing protein